MPFTPRSLVSRFFTLVILYSSLVISNLALARPGPLPPAIIELSRTEISLSANQSTEVKARVLDRRGNELRSGVVKWSVLTPGVVTLTAMPIDRLGRSVLISAGSAMTADGTVLVRASVGNADAILLVRIQDTNPATIDFDGENVELPPKEKRTVKATVKNKQGNPISDATIQWSLADPDLGSFVDIGPNQHEGVANTTQVTWLPGMIGKDPPSEIKLIARSGDVFGSFIIKYQTAKVEKVEFVFDPAKLSLQPGDAKTVKVEIKIGENKRLHDKDPKVEVVDEAAREFIKLIMEKKTLTVIALPGTAQKPAPPFIDTMIKVSALGEIGLLPISVKRDATTVTWDILPPNIVGDNYGRTIKNDFYCIEVTIQNSSGADLALAGLTFVKESPGGLRVFRPNTTYSTVHGSLEKRKLTHPRTLTLSIIDGVGSLMTGFVPFFHVDSHKANFSSFIDIISNPLAKGLANGWKDPYPDEVRRFEADVLRDDKIIPNNTIFKTKIFVPKRSLFDESKSLSKTNDGSKGDQLTNEQKRKDLNEVRKALGTLVVLGYRFEKGPIQKISETP